MKISVLFATATLLGFVSHAHSATVHYRVEWDNKPLTREAVVSCLKMHGNFRDGVATYDGDQPYHTRLRLERTPGVRSVTPIEPKNPMDSRRSSSLKQIRESIEGYRDNYLAYYRAVNGPTAKPEKTPGAGFIESYLHFFEERAYPGDTIDWSAYDRAEFIRDNLPNANLYHSPGWSQPEIAGNWEFVGPKNLTIPYQTYYGTPPLGGRLNGVAWHPTETNTLFIAGAQSGVWKTIDGGTTWTPLSDTWPNLRTSSIAIDPVNPNTIYVGTGDWDGGLGTGYGIQKSTDGGATWTVVGASQFSGYAVKDILIDPENPNIITVASSYSTNSNSLYRSTNGGQTWSAVGASLRWSGLTMGANSGGVRAYYASAESTSAPIYRSLDRGATWSNIAFPTASTYVDIAASPVNPNNVYVVEAGNRAVYRSTNQGASWTNVTATFPNGSSNYNWSQASYDLHILCSNNGANDVVYVGLIDLVQSVNGGNSWQSVGNSYLSIAALHNDQHCMTINPQNPNQALVGCDGGAFKFNYVPSNNTWSFTPLNRNLGGTTQFYHVAYHPTDPTRMIGGTQDNASPASLGNLNSWANPGAGDGCFQGISQQNPNVQYTTWQYLGMERTINNWASSITISPTTTGESVPFIGVIEVDPNNGNLCYAGTDYLHRYNASTNSWAYRLGGIPLTWGVNSNIRAIAVAKGDSNRIYVGTSAGKLSMSTNGGSTWADISSGTATLPNRVIKDISVNPNDPNDILIVLSGSGTGHVWRCPNTTAATRTWSNLSNGLPDVSHNTITRDPASPTTRLFVGTDVGVFFSEDGGANWSNATQPLGLPNVRVDDLTAVAGTNYLYAGTHGRGIWRISLAQIGVSGISAVPNPVYAANDVTLTVNLDGPAPAGGVNVALTSNNPGVLPVPTFVSVPAGSSSTTVTLSTSYTAIDQSVQIGASLNTSSTSTTVLVRFLLGDIDHDGEVGPSDFARFAAAFGSVIGDPQWDIDCDLDADGEVGPSDFTILAQQFGLP